MVNEFKTFKFPIDQSSKTPGDRNEIDDILSLFLTIQNVFGVQILKPKWTWKSEILKHVFTISLIIYVFIGTAEIIQNTNDITIVAEAVFTFVIASTLCAKCIFLVNSRNTVCTVYLTAKTTIFQIVREESTDKADAFLKKGRIVMKLFFIIVLIPMMIYMTVAFWNYFKGTRVTLSKTTSILMPMTSPYYEIGLALHAIFFFEMSFVHMAIDLWFVIFVLFFALASDVLVKILEGEQGKCQKNSGSEVLNERLRKFYIRHVQLIEYLNKLTVMYKWPTVIPLWTVLTSACVLLLLISEEASWSFASIVLPTIGELFAYNWFGELIKMKAERLSMVLFNFDWVNLRLKDMKSYCVIVSFTNKEFGIKTAVGNDLSVLTMSAVLKASYQVFAVLKTMK